jgi:putative membrane protein
MIVRPQVNWWRMLFVWNGSVLKSILPQLLFMLAVGLLALLTHGRILGEKVPLDTAPFTLIGVSLAIFLAFRNNASYDRHWEARKLWGHLLIAARSLASQAISYLPAEQGAFQRERFMARLIALVYALKHQLRGTDAGDDLARLLPVRDRAALSGKRFLPVALLHLLRADIAGMNEGDVGSNRLWLLDQQLAELSSTIGACERIANTPIPFSYGVLLHRTVYAYCILLPFGLVDSIGIATPLISVFVSYTLIALEAIAGEIADPFGLEPNNLALDAMARTIERSVMELNGETLKPEPALYRNYQLT